MLTVRPILSLHKRLVSSFLALSMLVLGGGVPAIASAQASSPRQQTFSSAAKEFNVPESILLAISYNESRWQSHGSNPSIDGGYGLMNLTTKVAKEDRKGTGVSSTASEANRTYTLDEASKLLGVSTAELQSSDRQNIRGGAAVLASYAERLNKSTLPTSTGDWFGAVAKYAGNSSQRGGNSFADSVFSTMQKGVSLTTEDGQRMQLTATQVEPNRQTAAGLTLRNSLQTMAVSSPECPSSLNCQFVPAAYTQNGTTDPTDYGNYDKANREKDMDIKYIVIHDTEGSYQSAIDHFQDPTSYVSCNYIIRSSDGDVTQMVQNKDIGWCAGDWYVNMHSINIEHEGFAAQGKTWYTEAMYQSSAKLVKFLADKYNVPLDREHIIGHDNVPKIIPRQMPTQHWDPGPYWDWNHYMALLHGVSDDTERAGELQKNTGSQKTVTFAPLFARNKLLFKDCSSGTCSDLPQQATSAVQLRTQPSATAPLVSDKYVHTDNGAGTNRIDDWGAVATTGHQFAYAGQKGDWLAIYSGGQKAWFYNPKNAPVAAITKSSTVVPRVGRPTVPVYGAAYPEAAAYPQDGSVPAQTLQPLYDMPAGQAYVTTGEILPTDYYYGPTFDYSMPRDHTVITGYQKYYQITYNHRIAYVKASDVSLRK